MSCATLTYSYSTPKKLQNPVTWMLRGILTVGGRIEERMSEWRTWQMSSGMVSGRLNEVSGEMVRKSSL